MIRLHGRARQWLKFLHLLTAGCWIGGALSLAVLNIFSASAGSDGMLFGITCAGHEIDIWVVIIPGAFGCLLTGLTYSLCTPWGFFKHKWVMLKWLITLGCIASGTFLLGVWEEGMTRISGELGLSALVDEEFSAIKLRHLVGGCIQLFFLLLAVWASVFKPWSRKKKTGSDRAEI